MPYVQHVLPQHNLVYTRMDGLVTLEDMVSSFEIYATHEHAAPGQDFITDASRITGSTIDDKERLILHSRMAPILTAGDKHRNFLLIMPIMVAVEAASRYTQMWDATPNVTASLATSEEDALTRMGLPVTLISELMSS
ncbi:MAG: hypothetical protein JXR13_04620 [Thalassovita sp.]